MLTGELYMWRCLQLAMLGAGRVSPNPMVGAVLVHGDMIIGEGYHEFFGGPHAEVNCLNSVSPDHQHLIAGSTLYVSLEPCNHFGKTPPCTDLIVKHRIPRVVVAVTDPFDKVNGSGLEKLRHAGVEVITGILEKEATVLNAFFFTYHRSKRPYVILKWAQSKDAHIAAEGRKQVKISDEISNRLVHRWRSAIPAIMVGTQTALTDNPSLTNRLWTGPDPVRVLIDRNLRVPEDYQLLDGQVKTIVINFIKQEDHGLILYRRLSSEDFQPASFLHVLYEEGINAVLVEGGSALLQSFINSGYWDEARVISNRQLELPEGIQAPVLHHASETHKMNLGSDDIIFYHRSINV